MSEAATHEAIEAIARNSYGRLIAFLASRSGDVAGAEDALSEAFVAALEKRPMDAVPERPEAWLLTVARNRLIDAARHNQVRQDSETFLQQLACLNHHRRTPAGNFRPIAVGLSVAVA